MIEDLFGNVVQRDFKSLEPDIAQLCDELITLFGLPPRSVVFDETISKAKGKEGKLISLTISTAEPIAAFAFDEQYDSQRTHVPMVMLKASNTKDQSYCEVEIDQKILSVVGVPECILNKGNEKIHMSTLRFLLTSDSLLQFLKDVCSYKLRRFKSNCETFGCCDKYRECSAAGHCLHSNKMFATSCLYKKNLEAGHNFYADK